MSMMRTVDLCSKLSWLIGDTAEMFLNRSNHKVKVFSI